MEKLPKLKDLNPPTGYFDSLPENILSRNRETKSTKTLWLSYAAAAVVIVSVGLWWSKPFQKSADYEMQALDEEVLLYIESNQWTAEDVLSLSEDPNLILDEIIAEEMPILTPMWSEENNWF